MSFIRVGDFEKLVKATENISENLKSILDKLEGGYVININESKQTPEEILEIIKKTIGDNITD